MERRVLVLRHLLHLAVEFGSGSLVDAAGLGQTAQTHGFENPQHSCRIHIRSEFRRVETHLHMALCSEVVDLVRAYLAHHLEYAHRIPEVRIMQMEMRLSFQMRYPFAVIYRRTSNRAVHLITLSEKEFRQKRTVLSGNPRNQCCFHCILLFLLR